MTEIEKKICDCLIYLKFILIALFVYLFVLIISEGVFTLQNVGDNAVGHIHVKPKEGINKLWQYPQIKTNDVGVVAKNSLFKNQENTMKSFVVDVNVIEESLHLEYL